MAEELKEHDNFLWPKTFICSVSPVHIVAAAGHLQVVRSFGLIPSCFISWYHGTTLDGFHYLPRLCEFKSIGPRRAYRDPLLLSFSPDTTSQKSRTMYGYRVLAFGLYLLGGWNWRSACSYEGIYPKLWGLAVRELWALLSPKTVMFPIQTETCLLLSPPAFSYMECDQKKVRRTSPRPLPHLMLSFLRLLHRTDTWCYSALNSELLL